MWYLLLTFVFAAIFAAVAFNKNFKKLTIIGAVVFFILFGIINYFGLPVLNVWGFNDLWTEFLFTILPAAIIGSLGKDEYQDTIFRWTWRCWATIIYVVVFISVNLFSSEMFNSRKYNKMLTVEEVKFDNFASDVNVIPVEKMLVADANIARKVVEDRLEEDPGLGSRCQVGRMTLQSLNGSFTIDGGKVLTFDNELVWVAPLEHSGFWKWVKNDVTPGYMLVYASDPTKTYLITEVNGEPLQLRYLESACFSDDIERHIRNNGYASQGITEHNFEIDFNGRPYWVLCNFEPTIGFKGRDAKGVITVDIQTGELAQCGIDNAPAWVDHIQPEEFVENQVRCWGEYKAGWWNSVFAQVDVQKPTPGMVLVYSDGQSYWYTGMQSAGGDAATSGFVLVNARTKEARYYRVSGVNEEEARRIAEDQNFAKAASYRATNPVLYNVRGVPTYFMTLTGQSGNITGYAFVAVTNRQAVGVGSSKREAENEYLMTMRRTMNDSISDGPVTQAVKTMTVRAITLEGNVYYILFEEVKGIEFTGSTEFFRELKWTKTGDKVDVAYGEGSGKVVPLDSFENLDFEI